MDWISEWVEGYVGRIEDEEIRAASRRADDEGRTMDDMKTGGLASAMRAPDRDQTMREFDNLIEMQHGQMGDMTGVMRRVEDLADRLLGAVPKQEAGTSAAQPQRTGWFGGLLDAHETRDQIIRRTTDALGRIEKVL